jgi:hypothetical protein
MLDIQGGEFHDYQQRRGCARRHDSKFLRGIFFRSFVVLGEVWPPAACGPKVSLGGSSMTW